MLVLAHGGFTNESWSLVPITNLNKLPYWVGSVSGPAPPSIKPMIAAAAIIHKRGIEMDISGTSAVTETLSECQSLHPASSPPLGCVRTVLTNSLEGAWDILRKEQNCSAGEEDDWWHTASPPPPAVTLMPSLMLSWKRDNYSAGI